MSWLCFREPLSLKTLICLGLALCIMGVQLFWK
jgi:multidrug transporter EmrE-like cation transporter